METFRKPYERINMTLRQERTSLTNPKATVKVNRSMN